MTPQQLNDAITQLEARAIAADRANLPATARSWREHAAILRARLIEAEQSEQAND